MKKRQYMVEFTILDPYNNGLEKLIPNQQKEVYKLFQQGKLLTYTLASNRSKLWAIFLSESESELVQILTKLPLHNFMDYDYTELLFHNSASHSPTMSLN
jgi:muconolactone delta-isomerase